MSERTKPDLPLLYRLLWPLPGAELAEPDPGQWARIAEAAREHRLRPLLHARSAAWPWAAPQDLAEQWRAAHRRSAERALHLQAELIALGRILAAERISGAVLKGGAIAWRGWFDPALRPMRDLDLLVDGSDAAAVQRLLLDRGYAGSAEANPENSKHLPGLIAPLSRVVIEIHTHLIEPSGPDGAAQDAMFRQAALARTLALPGLGLDALSDTDTLLHLILHGALDHQFNNGPLLVFDVLALLEQAAIDWPEFWEAAAASGGTRAAQLVFTFVGALVPGLAIDWCGHQPADLDPRTIESVAELMLVERRNRTLAGVPGRISRHGWRARFGELGKGIRRMLRRKSGGRSAPGAIATGGPTAQPDLAAIRTMRHGLQVGRWLRG